MDPIVLTCFCNAIPQAGAELCRAREKVGLAKPDLPSTNLWLSSIEKDIDLVLYLPTN